MGMVNERAGCGDREELARTSNFNLSRCSCGTVHLHMVKAGVTVQLADTMLAELVNVASAAQRTVELILASPLPGPASASTN
jgi:hypothetical protein